MKTNTTISILAAISIGIGAMIGAGIFSILGVVATAAGSAMWLSFLIGGIITNAAGNMNNPQKSLPIALYNSVFIVIAIYLAVSITVIGNLSLNEISTSGDFALALAAKPFLGNAGFKLISFAALFSTASAINATLFGAVNAGHLRILSQTGANKALVITSLILCMLLFCILEVYTYQHSRSAVYTMIAILVGSFVLERVI